RGRTWLRACPTAWCRALARAPCSLEKAQRFRPFLYRRDIRNPSPFKVRAGEPACQLAGIIISSREIRLAARVDNDGEISHGQLGQLLRPMQRRSIEEQR